jgi:hypothetical protein
MTPRGSSSQAGRSGTVMTIILGHNLGAATVGGTCGLAAGTPRPQRLKDDSAVHDPPEPAEGRLPRHPGRR